MHPRAFAARLGRVIFTNGKSDCELVAGLYADTLAGAFGHAEVLQYGNCEWTDDDFEQLAGVLPLARRLTTLWLSGEFATARGWDALAAAVRDGAAPEVKEVFIFIAGSVSPGFKEACEARGIDLRL